MRTLWVCLVGVALSSVALADGTVFAKRGGARLDRDPRTGDQRALIVFDGQRETLTVQTEVEDVSADLAWVVPTPSLVDAASAREAPETILDRIEWWTDPRLEYRLPGTPALQAHDGKAETKAASGGVTVHETRQVGSHTITTLTASESAALTTWLSEHGFGAPPNAVAVLADYIARGWAFTAVQVTAPNVNAPGFRLKPLALSFAASEAVFPLAISQLGGVDRESEVLLHIIAPWNVETAPYATRRVSLDGLGWALDPLKAYERRASEAMREGPSFVLEFAAPAEGLRYILPQEVLGGTRLDYDASRVTRLRAKLRPEEMLADVTLPRGSDQGDYEVRLAPRLPPASAVLVVGFAVSAGGALLVARRRGSPAPAAALALATCLGLSAATVLWCVLGLSRADREAAYRSMEHSPIGGTAEAVLLSAPIALIAFGLLQRPLGGVRAAWHAMAYYIACMAGASAWEPIADRIDRNGWHDFGFVQAVSVCFPLAILMWLVSIGLRLAGNTARERAAEGHVVL